MISQGITPPQPNGIEKQKLRGRAPSRGPPQIYFLQLSSKLHHNLSYKSLKRRLHAVSDLLHLLMVQRLIQDPRCHIRNARDPAHFHPPYDSQQWPRIRYSCRQHPLPFHGKRGFRRRLIIRPRALNINSLFQRYIQLLRRLPDHLAELRVIHMTHIRETGPKFIQILPPEADSARKSKYDP